MIYLLHGQDTVSSRNFLLRLKGQYQTTIVIDLKKSKGNFELPTDSLFEQKTLLILENSLPKNADELLPKVSFDVAIWLPESIETVPKWVDKDLLFKLSENSSTFKLADLIFLGQEKQALLVLESLFLNNTASELIIGTLVRQLRLVNLVLEGETEKVSKSSFVQKKASDQAKNWSLRKAKSAGLFLLRADLSLKKGLLPAKLVFTKLVVDLCSLANS